MATVLLYNIHQKEKLGKIKFILFKLGISIREVEESEFGLPVGSLLGLVDPDSLEDEIGAPFSDEMLVMHALSSAQFNSLLAALRQNRAPVALKAVVTDTNAAWSSQRLHRELSAEHAAMQKLRPKDSIHKK